MSEETFNTENYSVLTNAPVEASTVNNGGYFNAPNSENVLHHPSDLNMEYDGLNEYTVDHSPKEPEAIIGTERKQRLDELERTHQMHSRNVHINSENNVSIPNEKREAGGGEETEKMLNEKQCVDKIAPKNTTEKQVEIEDKKIIAEYEETVVTPCHEHSNIPDDTIDSKQEIPRKHNLMESLYSETVGSNDGLLMDSSQRSNPPISSVTPLMNYIDNNNNNIMSKDKSENVGRKESIGLVYEAINENKVVQDGNKEGIGEKEYISDVSNMEKSVAGLVDVSEEKMKNGTCDNDVKIYINPLMDNNEMLDEDYCENEFGLDGCIDETRLSVPYGIKKRESISLSNLDDSLNLIVAGGVSSSFTKNEHVSSVDTFSEDQNNCIQNDMDKVCSEMLSNKHVDTFNSLYNSSNNNCMEETGMGAHSYQEPLMEYTDLKVENQQGIVSSQRVTSLMNSFNEPNNSNNNNNTNQQNYSNNLPRDFQLSASFEEIRETNGIGAENAFSDKWDEFKKNLQMFKNDTMGLGKGQLNNSINYIPASSFENSLQQMHHITQNGTSALIPQLSRKQNSFNEEHASAVCLDNSAVTNASKLGRNGLKYSRTELSHTDMRKGEAGNAAPNSATEVPTESTIPPVFKEVEAEVKRKLKGKSKTLETEEDMECVVEHEKLTTLKMKAPQNTNKSHVTKETVAPSQPVSNKTTKNTKIINELPKAQEMNRPMKMMENNSRNVRAARASVDVASNYHKSVGNTSVLSRERGEKGEKGVSRIGKLERHSIANPTGSGVSCVHSGQDKDVTYNMNVVIRCRPMNSSEKSEGAKNVIKVLDNKIVVLLDAVSNSDNVLRQNRSREKRYAFDYAFDETCTTQDVYDNSVKCLIDGVIKGYNSTVFAYGATGAGKTHTIIGYKDEPGIMTMILRDLFDKMKSLKVLNEYKVMCSFIEIYNENIVDLLNPSGEYLDLREDPIKGVTVSNLFEVCTTSVEEIMELIHKGNKNRTQEPTDANKTSSRSHGILQIVVEETEKGQGVCQQIRRGKLCVIDLAGSERASQTNNKGIRMLEGANINRSLLALGNVINALVLRSKGTSKSNFIPFRDSKLTRLLKDSLGGNCRTVMIANISPSHLSYEDTHNTLKYANRAKNIKSVVTSNAVTVKHHLSMYVEIIEKLKNEIEYLKEQLLQRDKIQRSSSEELMHANSSSSNFTSCERMLSFEEKNYTKEDLLNMVFHMKQENEKLRMNFQNLNNGKSTEDPFYECTTGTNDNIENTDNINANMNKMYHEELLKCKEELENVKIINEKLFSDNKNFQNKLQQCSHIIKQFQIMNDDYKQQIMEYKKQVVEFKIMMHNHDVNDTQMKRELDQMKKKCLALQENKAEDKEYDAVFEKWKNDITVLLNERKDIKKVIFDLEKRLIENNEIGHSKFSSEDVKILKENKSKMDHQLKENVTQTNKLIKELPTKIKDQKMKNFLYLYYTNKVLIQEKEELQGFFELSSTIINQKEKHIDHLKNQLKTLQNVNVSKS